MTYTAVIAPHSSNPVTVELSKGYFERLDQFEIISLSPIQGDFEVRSKVGNTINVMPNV